jgi:hypothetical protein
MNEYAAPGHVLQFVAIQGSTEYKKPRFLNFAASFEAEFFKIKKLRRRHNLAPNASVLICKSQKKIIKKIKKSQKKVCKEKHKNRRGVCF